MGLMASSLASQLPQCPVGYIAFVSSPIPCGSKQLPQCPVGYIAFVSNPIPCGSWLASDDARQDTAALNSRSYP